MQVILKSKSKESNRSPHGVILNAHKKARNHSAWRMIHFLTATFAAYAVCLVCLSCAAFAEADLTFTVNVPPVLEITLLNADGSAMGDTVAMDVLPSLNSAGFSEKDVTVNVGTNNEWGYNLIMNVADTALTSEENNTIANLVEKSGGYTCTPETAATCDFTVNSWGFKIKNTTATQTATNYVPVPTSLNLNKNVEATGDIGEKTYVSFASRVNAEQAPGAYSTTIIFTAVANPDPRPVMQETSKADLAALLPNAGDVITMKDSRDNTGYVVGKLADGNYWMLDNLALDLTNDIILNALDVTNTDIDTTNDPGALAALKGTTLGTSSDKYATAKVANWTSSYSFSAPLVDMTNKDVVLQGGNDPLKAEALAGSWKVGGYYNYCAASAGSYCYGDGTSAVASSGNATSSICPKGWHVPSSMSSGEYAALYAAYSSASPSQYAAFRTAFHLPLSGYFYDGSARGQGSNGYFWGITRSNSSLMYRLGADTSSINPSNDSYRYYGYSVRCVKSDDPVYMQDVTKAELAAMLPNTGNSKTVYDKRDGSDYQITNIDGTYWMTNNLRIAGTVTADLSNFAGSDFDISEYSLASTDASYVDHCDSTNGYNYPCAKVSDNKTYGAYYNYCAASAGTVCDDTTQANAEEDICPAGWRLPTEAEVTAIRDSGGANFNTIITGYYMDGILDYVGSYGSWWSATARNSKHQYRLSYNIGGGLGVDFSFKPSGRSVRCVKADDPVYMQDVTDADLATLMPNDGDSTTLYDMRDDSNYQVTNIDGTYWMTDNLRITGTVTAALSNFTGDDFNISAGDLAAGNSYDQARSHYDNNETYGAYYNYCAASAGTVCSSSVQANAMVDICPSGWRLPTQAEIQTIVNANGANFNLVLAGYYGIGTLHHAGSRGYWWSAAAYDESTQYFLYYNGSWGFDSYGRDYGTSVRCVFGA